MSAPKENKYAKELPTKTKGGQKGNQNAVGNKGGRPKKYTKENIENIFIKTCRKTSSLRWRI